MVAHMQIGPEELLGGHYTYLWSAPLLLTLIFNDLYYVMGTLFAPQAARNVGDKEGRKWNVVFIDKGGSANYGFSGNWRGFCVDQVSTYSNIAAAEYVLGLQTYKALALHRVAALKDSSALLHISLLSHEAPTLIPTLLLDVDVLQFLHRGDAVVFEVKDKLTVRVHLFR